MGEQLRLDKLLCDTGKWSRKEAKTLIKRGRVRVNGIVLTKADAKVATDGLELFVEGERVQWRKYTYVMLYKPAGVLTATEDSKQPTVLDLLSPALQKQELRPVGRLDKDTEGLLLLTNDGALAHRLLAPKSHIDKVYYAETDGTVDEQDVRAFEAGMTLEDGLTCQSAGLQCIGQGKCLVTLREGKFHQVKRMLAARGKPVLYLKRLSMGGLNLDKKLQKGQYRMLNEEEIAMICAKKPETEKWIRQNSQKN